MLITQPYAVKLSYLKQPQMKISSLLVLFFICLHLFSCNVDGDNDECATVLCVAPAVLGFEVLQDMENVFVNGTFSQVDVSFNGTISGNLRATLGSLSSGEPESILFVSNSNWMEGSSSFEINFPDNESIAVQVEIENSEGTCCGGIPLLASVVVNGATQDLNGTAFTVTLVPN